MSDGQDGQQSDTPLDCPSLGGIIDTQIDKGSSSEKYYRGTAIEKVDLSCLRSRRTDQYDDSINHREYKVAASRYPELIESLVGVYEEVNHHRTDVSNREAGDDPHISSTQRMLDRAGIVAIVIGNADDLNEGKQCRDYDEDATGEQRLRQLEHRLPLGNLDGAQRLPSTGEGGEAAEVALRPVILLRRHPGDPSVSRGREAERYAFPTGLLLLWHRKEGGKGEVG